MEIGVLDMWNHVCSICVKNICCIFIYWTYISTCPYHKLYIYICININKLYIYIYTYTYIHIWGFPYRGLSINGGTQQWMGLKGKSYQNARFGGTPVFRKLPCVWSSLGPYPFFHHKAIPTIYHPADTQPYHSGSWSWAWGCYPTRIRICRR